VLSKSHICPGSNLARRLRIEAACLGRHALPERALDETIVAFAADSIDR